jgi:hypothetical protein
VYTNRIYGAGSAAELVVIPSNMTSIHTISYNEEGFDSKVSCAYNSSTAYVLEHIDIDMFQSHTLAVVECICVDFV